MTPSPLYAGLLGDPEVDAQFSDAAEIAAMIEVEAALARAQGRLGVLPGDDSTGGDSTGNKGARLAEALGRIDVKPAELADRVAADGVVVPGLVAELRRRLPAELSNLLHWGATSQDIVDSALMLRLSRAADRIEARLADAADRLATLADEHRATQMIGRTRRQAAIPIVFGRRAAGWLGPITRLRARLGEMRPRVFAAQLGGAAGDLSAFGPRGPDLSAAFAAELALAPAAPWHVERDRLVEIGAWLSAVAGAFGRIGADLLIMTRSEIGEIRLGRTGGSSTMPQKQNPVGPEAMAALGRRAGGLLGDLQNAAATVEERDGELWITEWMILPQLACAAGGAARLGAETLAELEVDAARMAANLAATRGVLWAEAASFALTPAYGREEAKSLCTNAALATAADPSRDFLDALAALVDDPSALDAVRSRTAASASDAIIDQALAAHRALGAPQGRPQGR